ncbi:MAG: phosphotransferase family protein [Deltaproteobacteria bacterium]|jgi:aminoglycoside phosphotransferase (APT) family kinase protein|nr:phosphotransferase family protein [Deltaproteobacteria bacterium]MBQ32978.1 phosphotransferase family protein [Deltaproteobacteria bacterium]MDP7156931.1 phosphotransferase family protein [SAR324 cluster bacterium]MDP7316604.1 phosphotransferase family protein [SAR324 cluster bacterium]MDP7630242.1 phosphotransferase family protein [SAR324 cluster bacterium]
MSALDTPEAIRAGEELEDHATLAAHLRANIPGCAGPLTIRQFPSGYSNLTYLLRFGKREFVLRRPPFGTKAKSAHDMGREFRVLNALHPHFPQAPKPLLHEADEALLGAPFYVMERISGVIVRKQFPEDYTLSPQQHAGLAHSMFERLAVLHTVDFTAVGLGELGCPEGYVRRQVEGWSRRWINAVTDDSPNCDEVIAWLHECIPETSCPALIHNDYKLDNLVLDPENPLRIIGVLDWEMATLGDPLMDLGVSIAYWIHADDPESLQKFRMAPVHLPGFPTRREAVRIYEECSGISIPDFTFYYAFGLFRHAVVMQQIYYRYYHGQTQDERFAGLTPMVEALLNQTTRVQQTGEW